MSQPEISNDVKLMMSLFSPEKALLESVLEQLSGIYGPRGLDQP
jgi:hypothetical protein